MDYRSHFIDFFVARGHQHLPSSSLVPENDPTVMLTTAGMQQFVPYMTGVATAPAPRLTTVQKCFRTPDIDEVGDASHLTFFEMLGNFSIGDYFKADAIQFAWEFLTQEMALPQDKLVITYFGGEGDIPADTETRDLWLKLGVAPDRVQPFGKDSNFWRRQGVAGPCGPCSELHFDRGEDVPGACKQPDCGPNHCARFLEVWNLVFMQYLVDEQDHLSPLPKTNIDTGMGLERLALVTEGAASVFDTSLFAPIMRAVEERISIEHPSTTVVRPMRIIADHLRGSIFLISDGVVPTKMERGYILRRLIRRLWRHASSLGLTVEHLRELIDLTIDHYAGWYPSLATSRATIAATFFDEIEKFKKTLSAGLTEFEKAAAHVDGGVIAGDAAFHLYDTYGFPIELTTELAMERNLRVDEAAFNAAFKLHQEKSRLGMKSAAERAGGGALPENAKAHTGTHLLHQALRDVLGPHVRQAGSQLSPTGFRFDFTHPAKLTPEEIAKVEQIINDKIAAALPVSHQEMTVAEAKTAGALGLFEDKYGDRVSVYRVGDYSCEICGGPHVTNSKEIGHFKILKEKSSSAGIRRIQAEVG